MSAFNAKLKKTLFFLLLSNYYEYKKNNELGIGQSTRQRYSRTEQWRICNTSFNLHGHLDFDVFFSIKKKVTSKSDLKSKKGDEQKTKLTLKKKPNLMKQPINHMQ